MLDRSAALLTGRPSTAMIESPVTMPVSPLQGGGTPDVLSLLPHDDLHIFCMYSLRLKVCSQSVDPRQTPASEATACKPQTLQGLPAGGLQPGRFSGAFWHHCLNERPLVHLQRPSHLVRRYLHCTQHSAYEDILYLQNCRI